MSLPFSIKPYASYSNYYSITNKSNESLLLLGGKADFGTGTTLSAGIGSDWSIDKKGCSPLKPAIEFKVKQDLGQIGDTHFNAQGRIRIIDGDAQYRVTAGASHKDVYASGHFSTKNGVNTVGGWVGYKNVEFQGNYNLKTKKPEFMFNFFINI